MYLTIKQQLKHLSKEEYQNLRELSHIAKNLTNEAIYNIRQYYFAEGEYLCYEKNYALLKNSPNYKLLNSNMSQQILKEVDGVFKSFFALLKKAKAGKYPFHAVKLPHYLKKDSFTTLVIGFVRLNGNILQIPFSQSYKKEHSAINIRIPPNLLDKKIKEIRIIPKNNARFFEIQYTYEAQEINQNLNKNNALGIDLGVSNFATVVTTSGDSFIIDGKKIKSINQWCNKQNAYYQSIKDKQHHKGFTKKEYRLFKKRQNQVNDYISKAARYLINYCIKNDIGTIIVGFNETLQDSSSLGKSNNQNLCLMPFGKFRNKLEYLCALNGIQYIKQEESYTSKASFWNKDDIPTYNNDNPQEYEFSGKRVKRGLYRTADKKYINADVNGALNILRKSNVVDLSVLYSRGEVNTPLRIRIS